MEPVAYLACLVGCDMRTSSLVLLKRTVGETATMANVRGPQLGDRVMMTDPEHVRAERCPGQLSSRTVRDCSQKSPPENR